MAEIHQIDWSDHLSIMWIDGKASIKWPTKPRELEPDVVRRLGLFLVNSANKEPSDGS